MEVLEPLIDTIGRVSQDAMDTNWLEQLDHFDHGFDMDQTHPCDKVSSRTISSMPIV